MISASFFAPREFQFTLPRGERHGVPAKVEDPAAGFNSRSRGGSDRPAAAP